MFNNIKEGVNKFINGIKNTMKKIGNAIKFFMTPIGIVVGWILLIIICVILLYVVIKTGIRVLEKLIGDDPNYQTFEDDIGYINDLTYSGYELTLDSENFQDFQAFEYAILMDVAEYLRQDGHIEQMAVGSKTDQHRLEEYGDTALDRLVNDLTERGVSVEDYYNIDADVESSNTRVIPPTLIYEFKKSAYRNPTLESISKENSDANNNNQTLTSSTALEGSTQQLLEEGKLKGSLVPYVYIIREDIDFTYYFEGNDTKRVVEYKYELNVNNPYMTGSGAEFLKEINRDKEENTNLGTVNPGDSWTSRIYYTDETTPIIYKIPLKTLIGRYMPRVELLQAWTVLKQDIDKDDADDQYIIDVVDEVIASIKGIYNEACLSTEEGVRIVSGENSLGEKVYYSDASTHNQTFVTFETAGIEKTLYGINGLQDAEGESIKVFTDCTAATVVEDSTIDVEVRYVDGTYGKETIRLSEVLDNGAKRKGYVLGEKTDGGYIPPSSFKDYTGFCVFNQSTADVTETIKNNIKEKLGGDAVVVEIRYDNFSNNIKEGALFKYKDITPNKTLGVNHTRMPILLVKTVTTWAREISYTHKLTQNAFDQNSKYYIIPNSVSSLGLVEFNTTLDNEQNYRGKAYTEIFARMKEKDVINILLQLEESGKEGNNDAYEFMRDTYKLLKSAKEYSNSHPDIPSGERIHPETYNYVYIPDTVYYYNDSQTQKIYWIDLFTAKQPTDRITSEELKNVRTKKTELTWQVVDYEKYDECNETGKTLVYAISPFNSSYLRAYYEESYRRIPAFDKNSEINGSYGSYANTSHTGADWGGRKRLGYIFNSVVTNSVDAEDPEKAKKVYQYELNRLSKIYGEQKAKEKIKEELSEQKDNLQIVAVAPGIVESVTYTARSGICVAIRHTNKNASESVSTHYMHLKRWPLVDVGDYVGAGTVLGYEGETGRAFGAHLHFEVRKGRTVSPCEYIYPTFNPFYNDQLAQADNYSLGSEYMSLYRTVVMTEDNVGVKNQHPVNALVNNFGDLIQNQGEFDRDVSCGGELGWNSNCSNSKEYIKYLSKNNYNDLYIKDVYQDYNLALKNGYLNVPFALLGMYHGLDFTVNTEMPGSLPALTREELVYILENWLPARYGNSTFNGMKKVDWLMKNVFTDKNIDIIIEAQNKYSVSAVFALAVATIEQNMGLSGTSLALEAYNIFSIKTSSSDGFVYQNGKLWVNYGSYGNAFNGFCSLIATSSHYYQAGKYTVMTIAPTYCNVEWGNSVSNIIVDIMQYYTGTWVTDFNFGASWYGNSTIAEIAKSCKAYYAAHNFSYCECGGGDRKIPPYKGTPVNGDFSALPVSVRKGVCSSHPSPEKSATYKTDCSTFVSWVLYEYGQAKGIEDFVNNFCKQKRSSEFQGYAKELAKGNKSGIFAYMDLVWLAERKKEATFDDVKNFLKEGDVLVYYSGSNHHVEIYAGEKLNVYNCGGTNGIRAKDGNPTKSFHGSRRDLTAIIRIK